MNETASEISQQLDRFYKSRGIHPLAFRCPHRDGCAKGAPNFGEARAALVGEEYGDPIRLVVVSSDRGGGYEAPHERTLQAVRSRNKPIRIQQIPRNRHWYRTHVTVAKILGRFIDAELRPDDVVQRFAHTNSVRCCLDDGTKSQAPARFLTRCKGYLPGELAVLRPNIVVTQGVRAAKAIPAHRAGVFRLGDEEVYWIQLAHPTDRRGSFDREAKGLLPRTIERAFAWWTEREGKGGKAGPPGPT